MSLLANARMYAATPNVREAWEALWTRGDLGAAFMCGFPFALATPPPHIIAAPIPSPARYGGLPRYCTDFVVLADRSATRLADTFGGRLGWTVEHSQSGYNAVRHHLLSYQAGRNEPLFSQWIGPLVTPRRVIDALIAGSIDVGPLDSYVHDLLKRHEPETASRLRTVESTAMAPIPPLIASHATPNDIVERLRNALVSSATDGALAPTRQALLLAGFVPARPADYAALLAQAHEADRAGIAKPAA
jgi:ABC-type phosphate/phosphonate transport system substrate-binding protein